MSLPAAADVEPPTGPGRGSRLFRRCLRLLAPLILAAVASGMPPGARADVRVVAAEPATEAQARRLRESADGLVERAARRLDLPLPERLTIVVARRPPRSAEEAERLGAGPVPGWAAGLAQPRLARIVLFADAASSYPHDDLPGVLVHEAAHVVLGRALPPGTRVPRWYGEGIAMVAEREASLDDALQLARTVLLGTPLSFREIDRAWPQDGARARTAYAQSFSFVSFSERQAAPGAPRRLVEALRRGASFDTAFRDAYGLPLALLEREWRREVSRRYLTIPLVAAGAVINGSMGVMLVMAWIAARRRRRRILAEWDEEERYEPVHDPRFEPPPGR